MKLLLLGVRLMAFGIVFFLLGCGEGKSSKSGLYTLHFKWKNTGTVPVRFQAKDLNSGFDITGVEVVYPGNIAGTNLDGQYTSPTTKILVSIFRVASEAGGDSSEITHIEQDGVHVSDGAVTFIYADSDGLHLNLDAGHQAGVP